MWGPGGGGDSTDWELSKENVQPLRQGRRVDVLNTSLQTAADEQTAQKIAEQRRNFELEIRTYTGDDPLAPWQQYVLWMEQHCPRGGHEGNLDGLLAKCIAQFSSEARYHQDARFVAIIIKQACGSQQALETFRNMFNRQIGTKLTMFYRAWSAQLELAGNMVRADTVLAEGERLGAQPSDELAEARRKLQTRVASALAAGKLTAQPAQIGRSGTEERHALGALRGSSDGAVPRQRVGSVQAGRPGTLTTAAPTQHPRHNPRLNVFVDENSASQPAAGAPQPGSRAELTAGRTAQKENVKKAAPWGAPQKAAKRPAQSPAQAPAFRVYEDCGSGAAHGSPITVKPGALAARAAPAPAAPLDNIPVAHFEPPDDRVKVMYCKDLIYAGAGEVSLEELRAAKWKKDNKVLLEQRRLQEEMERRQRRMHEDMQRTIEEVLRRNELLERQLQELKARPAAPLPPPASLQGSLSSSAHLGSSNVSGGSSSLAGHSNNLSGSVVMASPTVNTRDAMNYVREMLNRTVDTSVQVPRHMAGAAAPASIPFTVYEEPEASVSAPPQPPTTTPFAIYEEPSAAQKSPPPPKSAAPFSVYEDTCAPPPSNEDSGDSDQENRPPVGCPPPPPRRCPKQILLDAKDIPTEPLEDPTPFAQPAPTVTAATTATAASAQGFRRPLQFDEELTGFVPLSEDVSFAAGDLSQFVAAAGRVASTPFVPPAPPGAVGGGRARREEEEGEFTASLKSVRFARPAGDRTAPDRTDGGTLTPIMERSREQFKSSSSSSGSDMSRQSRCDVSAPVSAQSRQRLLSGGSHLSSAGPPPPPVLTQSSGYLGDRSGSVRPASVAGGAGTDVSMARRPDTADVSDVQAPDVSMAPPAVGSPDCSTLRPAELSEKAAELSLAPAAEPDSTQLSAAQLSAAQFSAAQITAELSALQPPAGFSPVMPPVELSALQPPAGLSPAMPPVELSALQPPAGLSPAMPPVELSALQPPAGLSPVMPPVELSALQPPAGLSPAMPPPDLSLIQPPADLSPVQPPPADLSGPPAPSAALSALTLQDPSAAGGHPDPWDSELIAGLLREMSRPVEKRQRYSRVSGKLPNFTRKEVELDGQRLAPTLIGEGAYARVYHCVERDSGAARCLKVQSDDGGRWEFYVVDELRERLGGDDGECRQCPFVMSVDRITAFDNGTVLCSEYEPAGSLLNVHNKMTAMYGKFDECLALLFTAEMLGALAAVHGAGIIHGDVKPDNFLLRAGGLERTDRLVSDLRSSEQPLLLQIIDFGRAIDMTLLPPGTTFTRVVTTDDFTCPEMKDGREWTFQTDLFGAAASAHVLLFGSYLKLIKKGDVWAISGTIRRFWSPIWAEFFSTFLNIPSCSELPDLAAWRRRFLDLALQRGVATVFTRLVTALKQR